MQLLRGHMAEYNRASDQFESNKNKLLKIATTKADLPTDKYVGERMREVSFAYNKLKVFILGCELSEPAKNQAGEEIKKVQLALDRVLRGEKWIFFVVIAFASKILKIHMELVHLYFS